MTLGPFIRSVFLAVLAAPYVTILVGAMLTVLQGEQSLSDASKILLLSPIAGTVLLVTACWWSIPATVIAAGFLSLAQRFVWASILPSVIVAAACIWQIPLMLSKFPHGDGGSMQSLVEQMKAVVATSIALWCLYFAVHTFGREG